MSCGKSGADCVDRRRWLSSATKARRNNHNRVEDEIWWTQEVCLVPSCQIYPSPNRKGRLSMDAYLYGCRLVFLGVDARDQIHVSWRVWSSGAGCFLKVEGPAIMARALGLWSTGRAEGPTGDRPVTGPCCRVYAVVCIVWCTVRERYKRQLVAGRAGGRPVRVVRACSGPVNSWCRLLTSAPVLPVLVRECTVIVPCVCP